MAEIKLEFNSDGFRQILMSDGMKAVVESAANNIKQKADGNIQGESDGYSVHAWQGNYGGGRWVASVTTTDYESMVAESESKALTRAVK